MKTTLSIAGLSVEPGHKARGMLEVTKRPTGQPIFIPIFLINGIDDGPIILFDAGIHGDEYEGPEVIRQSFKEIDPKKMKGVWIGVPVVNVPAFETGTRANTTDHFNLNRICPGKLDGFLTEIIAYKFLTEIAFKVDYMVDFHSGGNIQMIAPMSIWREIGDAKTIEQGKRLALGSGTKYLWHGGGSWGGTASIECLKKNIPAITVELGGEGRCTEYYLNLTQKALYNIMKELGMIEGKPEVFDKRTLIQGTFMHCQVGGLFKPNVKMEDHVTKGTTIGEIIDVFGDVQQVIYAPEDGIVCSMRTFPLVQPGDWIIMLGTVQGTI